MSRTFLVLELVLAVAFPFQLQGLLDWLWLEPLVALSARLPAGWQSLKQHLGSLYYYAGCLAGESFGMLAFFAGPFELLILDQQLFVLVEVLAVVVLASIHLYLKQLH